MNSASWTESHSNSITRVSSRKSCKSSESIQRMSIKHIFSSEKRNDSQYTHTQRPIFIYLYIENERFIARHRINPTHHKRLLHTTAADHGRQTNYIRWPTIERKKRERERSKRGLVTDTNGFGSNASANDDERGL